MSGTSLMDNILKFGNADQLGIVVHDIQDGMEKFGRMLGVREWYRAARTDGADDVFYKGNKIETGNDLVLGYCGKLQLELVSTDGDENIYSTHLRDHGEGLHHLGFFVSDLDARLAAYKKAGVEPVQWGSITGEGLTVTRYAYLDNANSNNITIEMIETRLKGIHLRMNPMMLKIGALMGDLEKIKV